MVAAVAGGFVILAIIIAIARAHPQSRAHAHARTTMHVTCGGMNALATVWFVYHRVYIM